MFEMITFPGVLLKNPDQRLNVPLLLFYNIETWNMLLLGLRTLQREKEVVLVVSEWWWEIAGGDKRGWVGRVKGRSRRSAQHQSYISSKDSNLVYRTKMKAVFQTFLSVWYVLFLYPLIPYMFSSSSSFSSSPSSTTPTWSRNNWPKAENLRKGIPCFYCMMSS